MFGLYEYLIIKLYDFFHNNPESISESNSERILSKKLEHNGVKNISETESKQYKEEFLNTMNIYYNRIKPQPMLRRIFLNPLPIVYYVCVFYYLICICSVEASKQLSYYYVSLGIFLGLYLADFITSTSTQSISKYTFWGYFEIIS